MTDLNGDFREYLATEFDVCLLCDLLEIEPEDIIEAFEDKILNNIERFEDNDDD